MKARKDTQNRLQEIEQQVMAEGREWTRQRLQERLQEEADRDGEVFPPQPETSNPSAQTKDAPVHRRRRH